MLMPAEFIDPLQTAAADLDLPRCRSLPSLGLPAVWVWIPTGTGTSCAMSVINNRCAMSVINNR